MKSKVKSKTLDMATRRALCRSVSCDSCVYQSQHSLDDDCDCQECAEAYDKYKELLYCDIWEDNKENAFRLRMIRSKYQINLLDYK
jgi:hypothetical protein